MENFLIIANLIIISGKCVSKSSCDSQCGSVGGTRNDKSGICICASKPTSGNCDLACKLSSLNVTITYKGITITNTTSNASYFITQEELKQKYNFPKYSENDTAKVKSVSTTSGLFTASYNLGAVMQSFIEAIIGKKSSRLLEEATSRTVSVSRPIICLEPNESLAFDVSANHYPVYLKDSLLNTVKDFDYGSFITLGKTIVSVSTPMLFMQKFEQEGVYVFGDSSDNEKQMIVKVSKNCTDQYINPITEASLQDNNVTLREDIITKRGLEDFLIPPGVILLVFFAFISVIWYKYNQLILWIRGKESITVVDKKTVGEPDEEEEMARMARLADEGVEGIFFVYLKQKLNEMDEKMRNLLAKANISSVKKLKTLADKLDNLKLVFFEHVNSLIMPNGMTIQEYIKANEDQLNKDESDYSSIFEDSNDEEDKEAKRIRKEKKKLHDGKMEELHNKSVADANIDKSNEIAIKDEENENSLNNDEEANNNAAQELSNMLLADNKDIAQSLRGQVQKRREDLLGLVSKQSSNLIPNEVQEIIKEDMAQLASIEKKLNEDWELQQEELKKQMEIRRKARGKYHEQLSSVRATQEQLDQEYKKKTEELNMKRKEELEEVDKETELEKQKGMDLIDKNIKGQLAAHESRFVQQFAESTEQDQLLSKHEGETARLKEHLESERRRQERDLLAKLEQRRGEKIKDVITDYKKKEANLLDKYEKSNEGIKAEASVIEASCCLSEDKFAVQLAKLHAEKIRLDKKFKKEAEGENIILDAKRRTELDGIEKEFQMEEHEILKNSRKELDDFLKRGADEERSLKDRFTKEVKTAPTSKEKNEVLLAYEKEKKALRERLEKEKQKMEELTELKLAERMRGKEKKVIQCEYRLEKERIEQDRKIQEKTLDEIYKQLDDMTDSVIASNVGENHIQAIEVPILLEYLLEDKLQCNLAERKKGQYKELSAVISGLKTEYMKEKFIEITAIKQATAKKIKELESKGYKPEKFKLKVEHIQNKEQEYLEALTDSYNNKMIEGEMKIRHEYAIKHCEDILAYMNQFKQERTRCWDRVMRRYAGTIPKKVLDQLNEIKALLYAEIEKYALAEKDKKLAEADKILGEVNQEEMKEAERRCTEELNAKAKEIEEKLQKKRTEAISRRKKEFEERLAKIPAMAIEQRKEIMSEMDKDMERLEKALAAAREEQVKRLREKLVTKEIQRRRISLRMQQKIKEKEETIGRDKKKTNEEEEKTPKQEEEKVDVIIRATPVELPRSPASRQKAEIAASN